MALIPDVMTQHQFEELVAREHDNLELKTGAGRKPLQESLVSFSNATGGTIVIGVSDARQLRGRSRDQGLDDDIHGAAHDAHHVGGYDIREVRVDGRPLVVIDVRPRLDEVAATSDGRILVRRGGHNRIVVGSALRELVTGRSLVRFESTDSHVPLSAADSVALAALARAHGWTSGVTLEQLTERGLATSGGTLTIAGALVLTDPTVSLGTSKFLIDVRAYESDTGMAYVRRETVAGTAPDQVERATELVMRDIGTDMVITSAHRHDLPRLPRRVVREAVANAVAHRAYDIDRTPVTVELRPSHVRITSPGDLPEPVTVQTLRSAQAPRNHTVIGILRRFGLAEDSGQGIDVIQDSMSLEMLADPVFTENGASVSVVLPLRGLISTEERGWLAEFERTGVMDAADRQLVLAAIRQERITNSHAREVLSIDSTTARTKLGRLRDSGVLIQHGTRGRAYYTVGSILPRSTDESVVLDAASRGSVTNEVVRRMTGTDRSGALALLRRLVSEGKLSQSGERRGTTYRLPD